MGRKKIEYPKKSRSFRLGIDSLETLKDISFIELRLEKANCNKSIEFLIQDWAKRYNIRMKRREKDRQLKIF